MEPAASDPDPLAPRTPPPLVSQTASRRRWLIHLVLIALYLFVIAVVGLGRAAEEHGPALSHTTAGLLKVCAVEFGSFAVIFFLAWLASRATIDDLLLRWRHNVLPVLLGAGYSVALRIAVGIISVVVGAILVVVLVYIAHATTLDALRQFAENNRPAVENAVDVKALSNNSTYFWLTVTLVSFALGGLREELWRSSFLAGMKGVWPRHFSTTKGQVVAVLICAVVFGLGHLSMGILAAALAGCLGVGLGLIMVFHRSIWPAVFAHGFFDATSMALIPWALDIMKNLPKQ